jgi:hypothetical protein
MPRSIKSEHPPGEYTISTGRCTGGELRSSLFLGKLATAPPRLDYLDCNCAGSEVWRVTQQAHGYAVAKTTKGIPSAKLLLLKPVRPVAMVAMDTKKTRTGKAGCFRLIDRVG